MNFVLSLLKNHQKNNFLIENDRIFSYQNLIAEVANGVNELLPLKTSPPIFVLESENAFATYVKVITLFALKAPFILCPKHQFTDPSYRETLASQLASTLYFCSKGSSLRDGFLISAEKKHSGFTPERERPLFIVRTSGSSGAAYKFILHDMSLFLKKYAKIGPHFEKTLAFSPLESIAGIETLLECIATGKTLVTTLDSFSPQTVVDALSEHEIDYLQTTPSFLNMLLLAGQISSQRLPALKKIAYGSEPSSAANLKILQQKLPAVALVHTYGMSEIGILKTETCPEDPSAFRLDSHLNSGKIINGLLWVTSSTPMLCYLNHINSSEEWIETNDVVENVSNGFIRVLGRNGDLLNVAGRKFFPIELENLILKNPEIDDVAICKKTHPLIGTAIVAKILLSQHVQEEQFRENFKIFCKESLPPFMHPHRLIFTEKPLSNDRFKKSRLP